jgi:hypothetical protein
MSQPEKPTESIYLPRPTIWPALLAFGLITLVVGLFAWWPYAVIGGTIALLSLVAWLRANSAEIARMPRRQQTDTAPIPLALWEPSDEQ